MSSQTFYGAFFIVICILVFVCYSIPFECWGWIHRRLFSSNGVKREVLDSLQIVIYGDEHAANLQPECPICLDDFAAGEEITVLPLCGHGFHAGCIKKWLVSHSTCPFCRQTLVVAAVAATTTTTAT